MTRRARRCRSRRATSSIRSSSSTSMARTHCASRSRRWRRRGATSSCPTQRVEGYRNFATKLWNAARFAEMNGCERVAGFDPAAVTLPLNRWALAEFGKAVRDVTAGIEAYRFNDAANAAYRFVWNVFCDWYLELAKPVFMGEDVAAEGRNARERRLCSRRHRQAPAPLHALHHRGTVGASRARRGLRVPRRRRCLRWHPGPCCPTWRAPEAEAEIGWLIDMVDEIRSARAETNVPGGAQIPLVLVGASARTASPGRRLGRHAEAAREAVGRRLRRCRAAAVRAAGRPRGGGGPAAGRYRRHRGRTGAAVEGTPEDRGGRGQGRCQARQCRLRGPRAAKR